MDANLTGVTIVDMASKSNRIFFRIFVPRPKLVLNCPISAPFVSFNSLGEVIKHDQANNKANYNDTCAKETIRKLCQT